MNALRDRAAWAPVAAAVALRAGVVWLASRGPMPFIDPDGYLGRAADLLRGVPWLRALGGQDGQIVPPLYSASLALARGAGMPPSAILVVQAVLGGAVCALVMALARQMSDRRGALIAGWACAVSPAWLLAAPAFWSEHLDVPLVALALLLLLIALRRSGMGAWVGVAFAAATLTRSIPLYAFPCAGAVAFLRTPAARRGLVAAAAAFAFIVGAYIAAASTAHGGLLLVENSPEWHWRARSSPETAADAPISSVLPAMMHDARTSPTLLAREAMSHVRVTFAPAPWNPQTAEQLPALAVSLLHGIDIVFVALLFALAIAGFATAPDRTAAYVLGAWIAVHVVLIALSSTNAGPRYRAPLDPALFGLAAAALRRP